VFGKKAGSVYNLKFVFSLYVWCLIKVLGLFIRFFAKHSDVSCYFTDHSESLDLTINLSSSTFDSGQRKATVLVCSLYLGLAPEPCRVPPLVSFLFFIYKVAIIIFKFVPSCVCHIFDFVLIFIFFNYSCFAEKRPVLVNHKPSC